MTGQPGYLGQPVEAFLDGLAAGSPAPAGGSAAALVMAQAAALCAKAARLSARQLTTERADQLTAQAERMRSTAASLIDADARAYRGVIEASRRMGGRGGQQADAVQDQPPSPSDAEATAGPLRPAGDASAAVDRGAQLADALSSASDVPMRLVELAAHLAELAAVLAGEGNPPLRGDAITAALLAQAAARAAATLVGINLARAPDDTRPARAAHLLGVIAQSVDRVLI